MKCRLLQLIVFVSVSFLSAWGQIRIIDIEQEGIPLDSESEIRRQQTVLDSLLHRDSIAVPLLPEHLDSLAQAEDSIRREEERRAFILDSLAEVRFREDAAAIVRSNLLKTWRRSHPLQPLRASDMNVLPDKKLSDYSPSYHAVDSLMQLVEVIPYDRELDLGQPIYSMPLLPAGYIPDSEPETLIEELNRLQQKPERDLWTHDVAGPFRRQIETGNERIRQTFDYYRTHMGRMRQLLPDFDLPAARARFSSEMGLEQTRVNPVEVGKVRIADIEVAKIKADRWHRRGYHSLQMSQTALSDNWYKGGDNNMNIASDQRLIISRYDENKRTTFETTLRLQLSGYYTKADTVHSMRVSDNTFRADVSYGYRASEDVRWKNWYYSTNFYLKTPIFDYYNTNSRVVKSTFLAPLETNLSVGMDYKKSFRDKKSSFTLVLAPVAYNLKYVNDHRVKETSYGIKEGNRALNQIGSSVTAKLEWTISPSVSWSSRLYYFTSYESILAEFENSMNFQVSRYFTAKLYLYPRFDDSADDRLQMLEMLTFGFSYNW